MKTKRMTTEQKTAVKAYWQAVDGQDRYLGSVFVSDSQTAYYQRLIAEREAECVRLGVSQTAEVAA